MGRRPCYLRLQLVPYSSLRANIVSVRGPQAFAVYHSKRFLRSTFTIDISTSDWSKSAECLVRTLSLHLERINETLSRYIGLQDLGGCISVQGSNIIALVALAEIYLHLSRNPTFHQTVEAQNHCLTALGHVVAAVKDLQDGNHLQKVHVYTRVS